MLFKREVSGTMLRTLAIQMLTQAMPTVTVTAIRLVTSTALISAYLPMLLFQKFRFTQNIILKILMDI